MKDICYYINENLSSANNQTPIGQKIDNIISGHETKLMQMVKSRQERWDANKQPYSREPMFLVADPSYKKMDSNRFYSWSRWKFIKDNRDKIKGTFKNYNVSNEEGTKPNSVIGIYYDRKFEFITSLDVFNKICDILAKEYDEDE